MKAYCSECGVEFEASRSTAKFCSAKCRVSHGRSKDLVPRGGRVDRVCVVCGEGFEAWLESKVARLVRNEMTGASSLEWGSSLDMDKAEFERLKGERMAEARVCSDECMGGGDKGYLNGVVEKGLGVYTDGEMRLGGGILRVRRREVEKN